MSDITKHKWSDEDVEKCVRYEGVDILISLFGDDSVSINKSDAIAIAKHFGLIHPDAKILTKEEIELLKAQVEHVAEEEKMFWGRQF